MEKSKFGDYQQNKFGQWIITSGMIVTGLVGLSLALTNPSPKTYEEYATARIVDYLKENVCPEVGDKLGGFLKNQCRNLVDIGRPQIKQILAQDTQRQNFLFFSIYETNLSISKGLPSYHIQTIGVFNTFIVYEAEEI